MKVLIVFSSVLAIAYAGGLHGNLVYARTPVVATATSSQYHTQDELGQYSYGYSGGPSSKQETKTADGITRGSYSYIDANGLVQQVSYVSDPVNGFRAAGTNFPVGPAAAQVAQPVRIANPIQTVNYAHAAPIARPVAQHVQHVQHVQQINYAPAPIARVPVPARLSNINYGLAAPAHPQQLSYAQAPLIRQVAAGFGGPVYSAQLPVPVEDTYEVKRAKAEHFRAYNEALARSG